VVAAERPDAAVTMEDPGTQLPPVERGERIGRHSRPPGTAALTPLPAAEQSTPPPGNRTTATACVMRQVDCVGRHARSSLLECHMETNPPRL